MKLNLTATDSSQERILAYLQENASESLANKINNGTPFTKDNVQLLNRKDLSTFMTFATEEAKKLATNGARYACVDDSTVFGWAIHYFEEESIEGKLYNLDGTEYKPVSKTVPKATNGQKSFTAPTTPKIEPPNTQLQSSFWDLLDTPKNTEQVKNNTVDNSAMQGVERKTVEQAITTEQVEKNAVEKVVDCTNTIATTLENIHIDTDTGEVLEDIPTTPSVQQTPTFDRETLVFLATLLDDKIDIAWGILWRLKRLDLSLNIF